MKVLLKQNWKCKVNITSMKHKWKLGSLLWEDSPTPLETGPFFLRLYWTMRSRHCFLGKLFQYLRPVSQTSKFSGEISGAFQTSPRNGEAGKARFGITRSFSRSGFRWSDVLRWSVSGGIWPPGRQGFFAADFSSSEKKSFMEVSFFLGSFTSFFFGGEHPSWRDLNKYLWISKYWLELYKSSIGWEWLEMVGKPLPVTSTTLTTLVKGDGEIFKLPVGSLGLGLRSSQGKQLFFK